MERIDATRLRGFAWFVCRDPAHDDEAGASCPFGESSRPPQLWWVDGDEDGIRNPVWGDSYLIVTQAAELPRVASGWAVEPADLDEGFQTGSRELSLDRLISARHTRWGIVQEGDFRVTQAEPAPHESPMRDPVLRALLDGSFSRSRGAPWRFRAAGDDWSG
jgi:hypothetical protein